MESGVSAKWGTVTSLGAMESGVSAKWGTVTSLGAMESGVSVKWGTVTSLGAMESGVSVKWGTVTSLGAMALGLSVKQGSLLVQFPYFRHQGYNFGWGSVVKGIFSAVLDTFLIGPILHSNNKILTKFYKLHTKSLKK